MFHFLLPVINRLVLPIFAKMEFPTVMKWMSPFPSLGLLVDIFHFYSNFKRNFCKPTVENLIGRRFLRHLIWFCTVCPCPTK